MMGLSVTPPEYREDSGATSPVGSSLLRVRRARAFATAERRKVDAVTETHLPNTTRIDDNVCGKVVDIASADIQSHDGLSQSALDSLCVAEDLTCCERSTTSSHVNLVQEGLDQAALSVLSVQDSADSADSDEDDEDRLRHLRRCRAFNGHQAAKELAEAELLAHWQHADGSDGISQATLDTLCISEDSKLTDVSCPDSSLHRVRRIRAFLGSSQALAYAVAEQNKFDLAVVSEPAQEALDQFCNVFDGQQTEAFTDKDDDESETSTEALLLRTRRMRAFLGNEKANQFSASMRYTSSPGAEDDIRSSASSQETSVCGSPESTGSMLLRIRRTRAFCGHERALALSEEVMAGTESHLASVASPLMDAHQISLGEENTFKANHVNHLVSCTTCSTKSSLYEEDHCAVEVVHGSKCSMTANLEVDAAVGLEMRLSSPTRKLRVMRGGA